MRWQFVGGMDEAERKAFLFTNISDGRGSKYDIPVVVGAIAANRAIYSVGMGAPLIRDPGEVGSRDRSSDRRRASSRAPCVTRSSTKAKRSQGEGQGLDRLPIPVSTPGFDSAPTLTATNVITRDPETGVQNMGTYRAALKAPDRLVVRMATRVGGAGGYLHYLKYQKLGKKDDALRDRARLPALCRLHGAAEAADRRGRIRRRGRPRRLRRSTWSRRRPSTSSSPRNPRS